MFVAIALPVVLFAGAGWGSKASPFPNQNPAVIDGPHQWVAFRATFTRTAPDGSVSSTGHIMRGSDGSYRWDGTFPRLGLSGVVIHNVSQRTSYILKPTPGAQWESQPMKLPASGLPISKGLRAADYHQSAGQVAGLETYERNSNGVVEMVAPALNFTIVKSIEGPVVFQFTSVVFGEPEAGEMVPPAGVSVIEEPNPAKPSFTVGGR